MFEYKLELNSVFFSLNNFKNCQNEKLELPDFISGKRWKYVCVCVFVCFNLNVITMKS